MKPNTLCPTPRQSGIVWTIAIPIILALAVLCTVVVLVAPRAVVRAAGPTTVPGGTITTNQTWTLADSPYIVQGWVTLDMSSTLTIEPGVEVKFDTGGIVVKAGSSLLAQGTTAQPIVFTSNKATPAPRDWGYISFEAQSIGRLTACDISYAGNYPGALLIASSDVIVQQTRVHHSEADGAISLSGIGITPTLDGVTIDTNTGAAIRQATMTMNPTYRNMTFANNTTNAVMIVSSYDDLDRAVTLDGSGLNGSPFIVARWVTVVNSATLTIAPGTEIQFPPLGTALQGNITLQAGSVLVAEGTASQPITLTTTQIQPSPAYWSYLRFEAQSSARLAQCAIGYGQVQVYATDVSLRDCTVHDGQGTGIILSGDGITPTLERVTVVHNKGLAIEQSTLNMNPTYRNVTLTQNAPDAVGVLRNFPSVGIAIDHDVMLDGPGLNGSPYRVYGWVTVAHSSTLVLTPGTTIQFGPLGTALQGNITVEAGSTLLAEGVAGNPVRLSAVPDNPYAPGIWSHVQIKPGARARLAHCLLNYGGSWGKGTLAIESSDVSVLNCSLHGAAGDAIVIAGGVSPVLKYVTVTGAVKTQYTYGAGIQQAPGASPTYHGLSFSDNVVNAIAIPGGDVAGDVSWQLGEAGVPAQVMGTVTVADGSFLTIGAGSDTRWMTDTLLQVQGGLYVKGSATSPVTFTGVVEQPGTWRGITVQTGGHAMLNYADMSYGGKGGESLLTIYSDDVVVQNSRMHHSGTNGIGVFGNDIRPAIGYNQIVSNTIGGLCRAPNSGLCYQEGYRTATLDARYNWWGSASGPLHPTLNPTGTGDKVSDNVLFKPWLSQVTTLSGTLLIGRMLSEVGGAERFSPGQLADYRISYNNQTTQTVESAVVVLDLPINAQFVDASDGGIYWPANHQVFWLPGALASGQRDVLTARVRYNWGVPSWADDVVVGMVGGSTLDTGLDVTPYLNYQAAMVVVQTTLSDAEIASEQQSYPQLATYAQQATAGGMQRIGAVRTTLSDGTETIELTFAGRKSLMIVRRMGDVVQASLFDPTMYTMMQPTGSATMNLAAQTIETTGDWSGLAGILARQGGVLARPVIDGKTCYRNCMIRLYANTLTGQISKVVGLVLAVPDCTRALFGNTDAAKNCFLSLQTKVPFAAELKGTMDCLTDCSDPKTRDKWVCEQSLRTCDRREHWYNPLSWYGGAKRSYMIRGCNETSGMWDDLPRFATCERGTICVEGYDDGQGRPCKTCDMFNEDDEDCKRARVAVARDPNAKYGPQGDVLPGEQVDYTITYENVGAGTAYGVYVADTLSDVFDDSTLVIFGGGDYISATRTLMWDVGDLAPQGQTGSTGAISFSVQLKPGLPGGTVVSNKATVYFPSVPEETPTNEVVNIVQLVVAEPQTVETTYMQPVAVQLHGREVSNAPLTYRIVDAPLYGTLSGTPPSVTYTPAENVTGDDYFTFAASNGITESRIADVQVVIRPSAADTTPPTVWWTEPDDNGDLRGVQATPVFTDELGMSYAPSILIQFSEKVISTTVTSATVQMVSLASGRLVANEVTYNDSSAQAAIVPREPLDAKVGYTVTLSGVHDLAGNPMAAAHTFSFGEGGGNLYLPFVMR